MLLPLTNRGYTKAPITEAVIDVRVELPATTAIVDLMNSHSGEELAYPVVEQISSMMGQMTFNPQETPAPQMSASAQPMGYMFRGTDGKQAYQARIDGFTLSRFAPYLGWDNFCAEAQRLWNIYRIVAQPSKIVRVAVRYINRIDIPLPIDDFGDYFKTVPQVASDLPQGLSGYFMQLTIPINEIKSIAIINEAIIQPARPEVVSIVLDIDVFRVFDLPVDEPEIWAIFEDLHTAKNNAFEACITDKARELFQ